MRTREQALADCLATDWPREACEAEIASSMVDGVYCDGHILITADGKRCIPIEVVRKVRDVRNDQPFVPGLSEPEPQPSAGLPSWVLPAGLALAGVVTVLVLLKRR
jgi:hypothetical protein